MTKNIDNYIKARVVSVIKRTISYMERTGRKNGGDNFSYLQYLICNSPQTDALTEDGRQKIRYNYILAETAQGADMNLISALLDLSIAAAIVPEFEAYLKFYTGYGATAQLACELEGYEGTDYQLCMDMLQSIQCVCFVDWNVPFLPFAAVSADDQLLSFIMNGMVHDKGYSQIAEWFMDWDDVHQLFVREEIVQQGLDALRTGNILQLSGSGGRKFISKHIAMNAERNIIMCDFSSFVRVAEDKRSRIFEKLMHGAFIYGGILCIYGISEGLMQEIHGAEYFYSKYVQPASENGIPVILCTDKDIKFKRDLILKIDLPILTRPEREAVWKGFAQMYDLKIDAESQSVYYKLSASQISRAVTLMQGSTGRSWTRVCFEVLNRNSAPQFGEIIYPQIKLKDLEVEDTNRELINQCISYAKYSHLAYEDEKLNHIYAYGRALTVLLNGQSGTGKTMTAHAVANELGMALYHVNLSQIADKYVGETEKHLERIFEYAENMPMVLFFDEADAILGKRTDISDGHDRYNNMNVSYILQRIEHFEGIIIFATNFKSNIDSAFMRRIKYIIQYGMPDAQMRQRIWENCLPDEKDLPDSELREISERFNLSGGDIKNIVIIASIMAKSSSEILSTKHIVQAIAAEYRKKGVVLNDMGNLRFFL